MNDLGKIEGSKYDQNVEINKSKDKKTEKSNLKSSINKVNAAIGKKGSQPSEAIKRSDLPAEGTGTKVNFEDKIKRLNMFQHKINIKTLVQKATAIVAEWKKNVDSIEDEGLRGQAQQVLREKYPDLAQGKYGLVLKEVFKNISIEEDSDSEESGDILLDSESLEPIGTDSESAVEESKWIAKLYEDLKDYLGEIFNVESDKKDLQDCKKELLADLEGMDKALSKTNTGVLLSNWIEKAEQREMEPDDPQEIYEEILDEVLEEGSKGLEDLFKEMEQAAEAQKNKLEQKGSSAVEDRLQALKQLTETQKNKSAIESFIGEDDQFIESEPEDEDVKNKFEPDIKNTEKSRVSLAKDNKEILKPNVLVRRAEDKFDKPNTGVEEKLLKAYVDYEVGKDRVRTKPYYFVKNFIKTQNKSKLPEFKSLDEMRQYLKTRLKEAAEAYMKQNKFDDNPELVNRFDLSLSNAFENFVDECTKRASRFIDDVLIRYKIENEMLVCSEWIEPIHNLLLLKVKREYKEDSIESIIYKQEISEYIEGCRNYSGEQNIDPHLGEIKILAKKDIEDWLTAEAIDEFLLKDAKFKPQIESGFLKTIEKMSKKDPLKYFVYHSVLKEIINQ